MSDKDFFVGYAPTPVADRRFFLGAGLALMGGTGALAAGLGALQRAPGPGTWDQGTVGTFTGLVTGAPYAMLRTSDVDGTMRTALLSCLGKCGVAARIGANEGRMVTVRGSVIRRGRHVMIAVADGMDWIMPANAEPSPEAAFSEFVDEGEVSLAGEIVDSKCWFGAMRPSEGKVHKACAALCIRGGLPPAFLARSRAGAQSLLVMTDRGAAHGEGLLEYVADPVRLSGLVRRRDDVLFLDAPVASILRL